MERNGRVRNTIRTEESKTLLSVSMEHVSVKCEWEHVNENGVIGPTITGIRQGRFLFPLLFVMYMDLVIREVDTTQ